MSVDEFFLLLLDIFDSLAFLNSLSEIKYPIQEIYTGFEIDWQTAQASESMNTVNQNVSAKYLEEESFLFKVWQRTVVYSCSNNCYK